jgi:hypothetical protein
MAAGSNQVKAANVTKYDAGGSGDNVIADGYVKTVEKVWLDSYTFTAVIPTADTITIATIPANKKITSVEVYYANITPTTCTINVGISTDTDLFIDAHPVVIDAAAIGYARSNNPVGANYVTTAETDIELSLSIVPTAPTAGTIQTIVRYT